MKWQIPENKCPPATQLIHKESYVKKKNNSSNQRWLFYFTSDPVRERVNNDPSIKFDCVRRIVDVCPALPTNVM